MAEGGIGGYHPLSMTAVLALNAGSSSLKYALFGADDPPTRLVSGKLQLAGSSLGAADPASSLDALLQHVGAGGRTFDAVGHRIVPGGPRYRPAAQGHPTALAVL